MTGLLPNLVLCNFSAISPYFSVEKAALFEFGNSPMIRPKPSKPNGKVSMAEKTRNPSSK
jgi:hypothetical protein